MALPGPPEIAWPPSKMVVGWTCKRCAGENRPCECISVRSLHQIVPNHPTGMSFSRLCLFLPIPERARPASWPGRISYTWPRLLVAPLSLKPRCPTRASRVLTRVSSIVAFPASVATVIWTDCYMPSYEREGNDDDFSSPIPYVDLFKFLFIKRSRKV